MVVLVGEFADDLLQEVLHGDQSGGAAVLVNCEHHVDAAGLHVAQQVVSGLGLRDPDGLAGEGGHRAGLMLRAVGQTPQDVLEVEDAADIIGVLPHDGHARITGAHEQAHGGGGGFVGVDGDHVGAGHHDLAHEGLAELDDAAHHLAVLVLDGLGLADLVDHLAQVLGDLGAGLSIGQGGRAPVAGVDPSPRGAEGVDLEEHAGQDQQGAIGVTTPD